MFMNHMWILLFFTGLLTFLYLMIFKIFSRIDIKKKLAVHKIRKKNRDLDKKHTFHVFIEPVKNKLLGLRSINMIKNLDKALLLSGIQWDLGNVLLLKLSLASFFLLISFIFLLKISMLLVMLMGLIGFMLPDIFIKEKVKRRKKAIHHIFPSFIDYLTIAVEAGLSMDMAIMRVISKLQGPLSEEIAYTMMEIKYGKPKKDAFKDLAMRVDIPEITKFITTIIKGEQLGISLGQILTIQGQQTRENRKQQMREKAYKIPVKLLFPLVIFILPAVFIVILGPAAIQLMEYY